jgi:chromosome segregation ATPase
LDKKTIAKLERTVKSLQEREAQLEREVEELSSEEKAKGGENDKQVKAMRLELKGVKGDLESKEEEVKELEEEMERIRKDFREKEKSTKRENRENLDLKDKIANLEVSLVLIHTSCLLMADVLIRKFVCIYHVQEEIDSLRRNNAALVEKAKKYRSEARAASSAQPKEKEKSASPEPIKKKVVQSVPAIVDESEEDEEEVVKAPKRAVRCKVASL